MDTIDTLQDLFSMNTMLLGAIRIGGIILAALAVMFVMMKLLKRLEQRLAAMGVEAGEFPTESKKRAHTLFGLARHALSIIIWLIAVLMVLKELGVEIGPMLAGAGIVGVAVGFGAQTLVKDYFGFFLILENQVRVGDAARINDTLGLVEKINFRTLVLRDLSGEVHIFPHGSVASLSNLSDEWSAYVFDIGVAYKENTDVVVDLIRQVAAGMRKDPEFGRQIQEEIEIFGVDQFADSAVVIKGRIKTLPLRQWVVGREFLRRIKLAFDAHGIEIPFPHQTLYFGEASKPIAISRQE